VATCERQTPPAGYRRHPPHGGDPPCGGAARSAGGVDDHGLHSGLLPATLGCVFLLLASRATAEDKGYSIRFILAGEEKPAVAPKPSPVRCGEPGAAALDELGRIDLVVRKGVDLYFAGKFADAGKLLETAAGAIGALREEHPVPPATAARCFVFRLLVFKALGQREQAEEFAAAWGSLAAPGAADAEEVPPDGKEFISSVVAAAGAAGGGGGLFALHVALPGGGAGCALLLDGQEAAGTAGTLKAAAGSRWVQAACGGAKGWRWKLRFGKALDGKTISLDPALESGCDCSGYPLIECAQQGEGLQRIGESLLLADPSASDFEIAVPKKEKKTAAGGDHATTATATKGKTPPYLATLLLSLGAVAAGGTGAGLWAWSSDLSGGARAIRDPWERDEVAAKASRAELAAAVLAGAAVALAAGAIACHFTLEKKPGKKKKGKGINETPAAFPAVPPSAALSF